MASEEEHVGLNDEGASSNQGSNRTVSSIKEYLFL